MARILAKIAAIAALSLVASVSAEAQGGPPVLAKQLVPARGGGKLSVTSRVFSYGADLNERFTQDGENRSPPINWTKGPTGTRSYAVLVEDSSVNRQEPISHWVIYDIPLTADGLSEGLPKDAELGTGALQGLNIRNETGFIGPKPPAGETHNYHIQVFALNTRLALTPNETDRNDVVQAMKGHVLAVGDLVVKYKGK